MKTQKKYLGLLVATLGLCLAAALPLSAQMRQGRRMAMMQGSQTTRDSLVTLRNALNQAGATALSSAQEQQLKDLISTFRSERKSQSPDTVLKSAKKNYDEAILSGNVANATTAADQLAKAVSDRSLKSFEARATFLAKAYAVLQSDQVSALESSVGKDGVLKALRSLIGPMGMGKMRRPGMTS
jgi:Spy/CpxP family protein refolding chaperone